MSRKSSKKAQKQRRRERKRGSKERSVSSSPNASQHGGLELSDTYDVRGGHLLRVGTLYLGPYGRLLTPSGGKLRILTAAELQGLGTNIRLESSLGKPKSKVGMEDVHVIEEPHQTTRGIEMRVGIADSFSDAYDVPIWNPTYTGLMTWGVIPGEEEGEEDEGRWVLEISLDSMPRDPFVIFIWWAEEFSREGLREGASALAAEEIKSHAEQMGILMSDALEAAEKPPFLPNAA